MRDWRGLRHETLAKLMMKSKRCPHGWLNVLDCPYCKIKSERDDLHKKYNELLFVVERRFPGETRHETALRYLKEAQSRTKYIKRNPKSLNPCPHGWFYVTNCSKCTLKNSD